MIYYTGDIHGDPYEVIQFCDSKKLTEQDTLVLLGDVGANYYRNRRDTEMKRVLAAVKPTMLCIHGNHEIRPASIPSYRTKQWNGGTVWVEEAFPRLLFAMDGEIFDLEGLRHLVIGGAYSVDKFYRLARGYGWWPDEQPSQEIKDKVIQTLDACGWQVDTVLSHTCPYPYEPREAFLPMIDQSTVDDSTEKWLEEIEQKLKYDHWFCGHWHIDKHIDRMHFLFHSVEGCAAALDGRGHIMTEEERPEAKEQEACFAAIREIVQEISRLMDAAYQQYSRLVEQVLNGRITEEREIERIMDGLVDFGDNPRLLELYKTLCRHVYYKYPALVGEHTALFRLQFEETEDGDTDTEEVET